MNCPHCNQPITVDSAWDFFECQHCKASLQKDKDSLSLLKEPEENPAPNTSQEQPIAQEEMQEQPAIQEPEEVIEDISSANESNENLQEEDIQEQPIAQEPEEVIEEASPINESSEEPQEEEIQEQPIAQEQPATQEPPNDSNYEKNISDFGNAPMLTNNFVYELYITQINSTKALAQLKNLFTH